MSVCIATRITAHSIPVLVPVGRKQERNEATLYLRGTKEDIQKEAEINKRKRRMYQRRHTPFVAHVHSLVAVKSSVSLNFRHRASSL